VQPTGLTGRINKATPTISTPPTAAAIELGKTLSNSTLTSGVATVSGTFAFTTPVTTPALGTVSHSVTFTPTDNTNYNTQTCEVSVTVILPKVKDGDGNTYESVLIGNQIWMKENLRTTSYNDGTLIPNLTANPAWVALTTPGYCWYNNDLSTKATYGALYNWYAVTNGILAEGWHVPTDAEWDTLANVLGGATVAGGKLKATTRWASSNTVATNESGFSALPGGFRNYIGLFFDQSNYGYWWSASVGSAPNAYYRNLAYDDSTLYKYSDSKVCGFSVRLVRD
jgi:uncharacterized protein (TIGR02145 family)